MVNFMSKIDGKSYKEQKLYFILYSTIFESDDRYNIVTIFLVIVAYLSQSQMIYLIWPSLFD